MIKVLFFCGNLLQANYIICVLLQLQHTQYDNLVGQAEIEPF